MWTRKTSASKSAAKFVFDAFRLGATANMVIGLRLAKIAAGGQRADAESRRMVAEKVKAAQDAGAAAATQIAKGAGAGVPGRTLALYQKKVSANLRRLSKGG